MTSVRCAAAAEPKGSTAATSPRGGEMERDEGLSTLMPAPATAGRAQSSWQPEVVASGPNGLPAACLLEQDLAWERQQKHSDRPNARDANGAREGNESSRVRQAAMAQRTSRELCVFSSIPSGRQLYHARVHGGR